MRAVAVMFVSVVFGMLSACLPDKPGTATLKNNPSAVKVEATISEDGQEVSGSLSASAGEIQTLTAPEGSAISGIQTSFPPGAISIDTQISMAPGANITSLDEVATLGIGQTNQVGASVSIESTVPFNAAVPFSVAISIEGSGLHLQDGANNFAVIYKAKDIDSNALIYGVIPASEITIVNGKAVFKTRYFGTYQLVKTEVPVIARQETKVASLIAESPAVIHGTMPMIADGGRQVTINGKGFTGKMLITIAGLPVRQLNVRSDVQASFVVPEKVPFGFTNVEAEQAGVKHSYPLLARSSDKLSLPLITMDPSGVCIGVNYYDANGVQQKGTKACDGAGGSGSKAGYADTAGYADVAGEASFARGKIAKAVTAAASVVLPSDGDYFEVSGSALIKNFGLGSKGQFVKIEFRSEVLVAGQNSSPKLLLSQDGPLVTSPGTILLLIGTGDGWREIGRDQPVPVPAFYGVLGFSGIVHTANSQNYTPSTFVFDHVSLDPAQFSYNSQTGELKPLQTRLYRLETGFHAEQMSSEPFDFVCFLGLEKNGQIEVSQSGQKQYNEPTCGRDHRSYAEPAASVRELLANQGYRAGFSARPTYGEDRSFRLSSKPSRPVYIKLYPAPAPQGP